MRSKILIGARYGGPEVLDFVEQELGPLQADAARVEVKAAGINPVDARRMIGELRMTPIPQAFGTEFAGVIVDLPPGTDWAVGDEVLGSGDAFTHATVIDVPLANLVRRPASVDWVVAGSLAGAGQTAITILEDLGNISSLLIHGASGGVGSITAQLARAEGIDVVGTASEANLDYLRALGAIPVAYGSGLAERLRQVHPAPFDASIDMAGTEEATQASLACVSADGVIASISGVPASSPRVRSIGRRRSADRVQRIASGVADGSLRWDVSKTYPFDRAAEAYEAISTGHTRGKSVLTF